MGISSLVNATQGDSSTRSHSRLARTGRQRTFVLKQKEDDDSKPIKDGEVNGEEPMPSTSRQDYSTDRQTRSAIPINLPNRFQKMNGDKPTRFSYENRDELVSSRTSKPKSRFKRVSVDENELENKEDEKKEFNQIRSKVDNRLDKTYSWKKRLIGIVTGSKEKVNENLMSYQNEYDFFTRQSKGLKQPNKLENLLNNQLKSYLESHHNLYYPSMKKANMLLAYPNLDDELKNFIKQNDLSLNQKFTQRILIEINENLAQKNLDLILKRKDSLFELSTNLEDIEEEYYNEKKESSKNQVTQPARSSITSESSMANFLTQTSQIKVRPISQEFYLRSIRLRFLRHKHSTREMNLISEIISNLEFINELQANECIKKLTIKIEKLKEVIELIESCIQEYEAKMNVEQRKDESLRRTNEIVRKMGVDLLKNYLMFLNFLFLERDRMVQELRRTLFNLLRDWKEVSALRMAKSDLRKTRKLILTFDEQNQFNPNEHSELNALIEERLFFERKFVQFNKPTNSSQFNQKFKTMFNKLVSKNTDESNENLIDGQEDNEMMYSKSKNETMHNLMITLLYLNIKNKTILLDGRLPDEPRFLNFQLFYEQPVDSESTSNALDDEPRNEEKVDDAESIKLDKLKRSKYLLQIENNGSIVYETEQYELDENLQITFADILTLKETLEGTITGNLIELKSNRKKQLANFELNVQQILIETLLHNNINFSIKTDFSTKLSSGELVFELTKKKSTDDEANDASIRTTNSIDEEEPPNNEERTEIKIKYDFNDHKSTRFRETKDEWKDKVRFVAKMKSEIYEQQELNNLLKIVKRNYQNNQIDQSDQLDRNNDDDDRRDKEQKQLASSSDLFGMRPVELNQRLLLLKQRNEDEEMDKRRIPLYDSHYLSFLIKDKQEVKTKSNYLPIELTQTNANIDLLKAYDSKKKAIIDYLIDVRRKFNQSNTWNKNSKNFEDYVYEEIDTSLSTLNFDFLFFTKESKRPLRPTRKERKKYSGQSLVQQLNTKSTGTAQSKSPVNQNEKVKIMINIMSGQNIPVRRLPRTTQVKETTANTDVSSSQQQLNQNYANFTKRLNELFYDEMHSYNSLDSVISKNIAIDLSLKEQKVWPFLEVSFQDQTLQTSVAESSQPAWNETIKLDLDVPNDDYSPASLLKIDDFIYLNLFDQVEVVKDDEIELERTFNAISPPKKYTKNWLGSISIPFITLYLNGKIEGTFCLEKKPTYLTDYDFETKPTFSLLTSGHNQELDSSYFNNLDSRKNSYLNLFLTIDPQLNPPSKIEFKCSTDEETVIYNYAKDWQSQLNKKYPKRQIKSLVINLLNGKHTLANRYLSPLEPPAEFLNTEQYNETTKDYKSVLMKNLARYVSFIPLITNELSSIGLMEEMIWADCEQFLKMNIGCVEEHAILLCNYFLYLGLNSGLVLGAGVPEGKTCYVIVWLNELSKKDDTFLNVQLWHPISGQCYFVHTDNFLPLSSADCIITKENVYANIQKEDDPNQISFNIAKLNCWKPLFNLGKMKVNLHSVQPKKFEYETVNESYARNLEQQIEVYLKESLMKWRRQKKTFFNRYCTKEIKKELAQMEYKVCHLRGETVDPNEEINKILSTYQINGLQLNVPFNGIKQLTKQIYSTGLHLVSNDKVDFVIAVHLHSYPQNVYSVWIYCAQIQAMRQH